MTARGNLFEGRYINLRSSDSLQFPCCQKHGNTQGNRAFVVVAPRLWNALPKELRTINFMDWTLSKDVSKPTFLS